MPEETKPTTLPEPETFNPDAGDEEEEENEEENEE